MSRKSSPTTGNVAHVAGPEIPGEIYLDLLKKMLKTL